MREGIKKPLLTASREKGSRTQDGALNGQRTTAYNLLISILRIKALISLIHVSNCWSRS